MTPVATSAAPAPLWHRRGAHVDGDGVRFAIWAPRATAVSVIGDFNDWDGRRSPLERDDQGAWHGRVEGIGAGALYQYAITTADGRTLTKSDPFAFHTQLQPQRSSIVHTSTYVWQDETWLAARADRRPHSEPFSVFEVHLGSWRLGLSYRQLAVELVGYVSEMGFTHVELMPVMEHPFLGSWGYQVTGYFAPTSRYGTPDDFRHLIDAFHTAGIGVILDWVPGHFPQDEWALAELDGEPLYEPPEIAEHVEWGTRTFDYTRPEVREFLIANALYWLTEFHADGLRVDAVASMLYLDYGRGKGEWQPNVRGGRENLEAVTFLQDLNTACYLQEPGIAMIAEDSTAWPRVTTPVHLGGLGFGFKWNLGWMHDSLAYLREDPLWRQQRHREMTFSTVYAHSDNFLLPLSHDEVVHGKGSLVRKMPGSRDAQLATLRAYLGWQWAHPGKQLLFMGQEFGQDREWSERRSLDWAELDDPTNAGIRTLVRHLNAAYVAHPALWELDHEPDGFRWIEEHDAPRNVFSFIRSGLAGEPVVCVSNFAGIDHTAYDLGLPLAGAWTTLIDTSAAIYGGAGGFKTVVAEALPHQGCPASATVHLPALSTIMLAPTPDAVGGPA